MSFYDISYKALEQERVRLNDKLNQIYEDAHQMEGKWRDAVKERDQYKAERDTLIDDIAVLKANNDRYRKRAENAMEYAERSQCEVLRLERENEQRKKEQKVNRTKASLLTEIEQFKEKNEKLSELNNQLTFEVRNYEHDSKALRLQSNTYFDEWQSVKKQYTTLTNHIRMKAEHNPGVSRYLDLVNYIDRLDRD